MNLGFIFILPRWESQPPETLLTDDADNEREFRCERNYFIVHVERH